MVICVNIDNCVKRKEMIMAGRVKVIQENKTGRNRLFQDTKIKGEKGRMTRSQFVRKIEDGLYPNYHVRKINRIKTPVSNPDMTTKNNLN
jgi:hypothetical protein